MEIFSSILIVWCVFFGILLLLLPWNVRKIRTDMDATKKELETTNKLLRQLIKANGHDPEA